MPSKFEKKEGSTSTAKGFFNLRALMSSGKRRKLGGILDGDNLDTASRELLEKLVSFGDNGKTITLIVDYNAFNDDDGIEDDFA